MRTHRLLAAALAAGAIAALPTAASAAPVSVGDVAMHTTQADAALDRAAALLDRDRQGPALAALNRSRVALGQAQRLTDGMVGRARTDAARTRAAKAVQRVGQLRDRNLTQLVAMLQDSDPRADRAITRALLADTVARDTAIGVLQGLIDAGVAPRAEGGLARAIAALSGGRAQEVGDQAQALTELTLPRPAEVALARALSRNLAGQAQASAILAALLPQLPPSAQAEVQEALDLLNAQLEQAVQQVEAVTADLPPGVRDMVNGIVAQAFAIAGRPLGALPGVPGGPGVPGIGAPGALPNPADLIPALPNPNDLVPQLPGVPGGVVPQLPNPNDLIPDVNGLIPDVNGLIPDVNGLIPDVTGLIPDVNGLVPGVPGVGGGALPLPIPLPIPIPIPDIGGLLGGILGGVGVGAAPPAVR